MNGELLPTSLKSRELPSLTKHKEESPSRVFYEGKLGFHVGNHLSLIGAEAAYVVVDLWQQMGEDELSRGKVWVVCLGVFQCLAPYNAATYMNPPLVRGGFVKERSEGSPAHLESAGRKEAVVCGEHGRE